MAARLDALVQHQCQDDFDDDEIVLVVMSETVNVSVPKMANPAYEQPCNIGWYQLHVSDREHPSSLSAVSRGCWKT